MSAHLRTTDPATYEFPWSAILIQALAPYPDLVDFCMLLLDARDAMRAEAAAGGDRRWLPVSDWLDDTADLAATKDPFMPRQQKTTEWLERNYRTVLHVARTFLDGADA